MTLSCPEKSRWDAWLHGKLPEPEWDNMSAHLGTCQPCQRLLDELSGGSPSWAEALRAPHSAPTQDPALLAILDQLKEQNAWSDLDLRTLLQPSDNPNHLGRLDGYEILSEIGRGGMGVVLKAFDPKLQRIVAIKMLAPHLAASAAARQRFLREARAAAAVVHEHVVTIHAVEEPPGRLPYLVLQFIDGRSLEERLDRDGPLELKEILRIGIQTASGLAAAHAQGLVHRDVEPANILLENGVERVKLADFGLARAAADASLTQSGVIAGSPLYMAPEQARGEMVDHRADLFGLGCVLYAMCAGHPPFRADTPLAVLKRVCDDSPRPLRELNPDVPHWLEAIIFKLLAKEPEDRFQSAAEVADLLGQHLRHLQQPTQVPLPPLVRTSEVSEDFGSLPTRRRSLGLPILLMVSPLILVPLLVGLGFVLHLLGFLSIGMRTILVLSIPLSGAVFLVGLILLIVRLATRPTAVPATDEPGEPPGLSRPSGDMATAERTPPKNSSNKVVWVVAACVLGILLLCPGVPILGVAWVFFRKSSPAPAHNIGIADRPDMSGEEQMDLAPAEASFEKPPAGYLTLTGVGAIVGGILVAVIIVVGLILLIAKLLRRPAIAPTKADTGEPPGLSRRSGDLPGAGKAPPKKSSNKVVWVVVACVLGLFLCCAGVPVLGVLAVSYRHFEDKAVSDMQQPFPHGLSRNEPDAIGNTTASLRPEFAAILDDSALRNHPLVTVVQRYEEPPTNQLTWECRSKKAFPPNGPLSDRQELDDFHNRLRVDIYKDIAAPPVQKLVVTQTMGDKDAQHHQQIFLHVSLSGVDLGAAKKIKVVTVPPG